MHNGHDTDNLPTRWAWYSICVNVVLVGLNALVATASGSLAVGTEVAHNIVDLVSAVAVLLGVKLATRKSREFPYGLYKLENVIAVAVAVLIFLTVYEIVRHALLGSHRQLAVNWWMFLILLTATLIPAVFGRLELRAGRATRSPALVADAKEYHVHVLTTGVVLAALIGEYFGLPVDRLAALIIVVPVAKTGWDLLSEGMRVLLDVSLDSSTLETIRQTVLSDPMVADVQAITGRSAGRFRFVEITPVLRGNDLQKADQTAHRIEGKIREAVPNVERVLVHVDPKPRDRLRCAVPLSDEKGAIARHFGNAPYFAFATVYFDGRESEPARILPNPHRDVVRGKGMRVAEWLVQRKTDMVVLRDGPAESGPMYVLGDAAVSVHHTNAATLSEALSEVRGSR